MREKKHKILIIDDTVDTVRLLNKRLSTDGYEVYEAFNGEEGLERALEVRPDLIILDIMMPKLGGFEVCKKLKEDRNQNNNQTCY